MKFSSYGKPITGTNIIPCKVPLDNVYSNLFDPEPTYNMEMLLEQLQKEGFQINAVIDFNRSDEYYSFE